MYKKSNIRESDGKTKLNPEIYDNVTNISFFEVNMHDVEKMNFLSCALYHEGLYNPKFINKAKYNNLYKKFKIDVDTTKQKFFKELLEEISLGLFGLPIDVLPEVLFFLKNENEIQQKKKSLELENNYNYEFDSIFKSYQGKINDILEKKFKKYTLYKQPAFYFDNKNINMNIHGDIKFIQKQKKFCNTRLNKSKRNPFGIMRLKRNNRNLIEPTNGWFFSNISKNKECDIELKNLFFNQNVLSPTLEDSEKIIHRINQKIYDIVLNKFNEKSINLPNFGSKEYLYIVMEYMHSIYQGYEIIDDDLLIKMYSELKGVHVDIYENMNGNVRLTSKYLPELFNQNIYVPLYVLKKTLICGNTKFIYEYYNPIITNYNDLLALHFIDFLEIKHLQKTLIDKVREVQVENELAEYVDDEENVSENDEHKKNTEINVKSANSNNENVEKDVCAVVSKPQRISGTVENILFWYLYSSLFFNINVELYKKKLNDVIQTENNSKIGFVVKMFKNLNDLYKETLETKPMVSYNFKMCDNKFEEHPKISKKYKFILKSNFAYYRRLAIEFQNFHDYFFENKYNYLNKPYLLEKELHIFKKMKNDIKYENDFNELDENEKYYGLYFYSVNLVIESVQLNIFLDFEDLFYKSTNSFLIRNKSVILDIIDNLNLFKLHKSNSNIFYVKDTYTNASTNIGIIDDCKSKSIKYLNNSIENINKQYSGNGEDYMTNYRDKKDLFKLAILENISVTCINLDDTCLNMDIAHRDPKIFMAKDENDIYYLNNITQVDKETYMVAIGFKSNPFEINYSNIFFYDEYEKYGYNEDSINSKTNLAIEHFLKNEHDFLNGFLNHGIFRKGTSSKMGYKDNTSNILSFLIPGHIDSHVTKKENVYLFNFIYKYIFVISFYIPSSDIYFRDLHNSDSNVETIITKEEYEDYFKKRFYKFIHKT